MVIDKLDVLMISNLPSESKNSSHIHIIIFFYVYLLLCLYQKIKFNKAGMKTDIPGLDYKNGWPTLTSQ